MATIHHTSAETTIPELERLLGVELCAETDAWDDGNVVVGKATAAVTTVSPSTGPAR